jgi:ATP-dependent Clp protease, protease subunit
MLTTKKNKKLDLMELFGKSVKQDERIFTKQLINIHEFYLSGDIESSEEYIQWFDIIRHSGENDVIKIYINSGGGDVFTAIQFMRALNETSATVVMSVEGLCASAATMILLCGETFEISEHSMFMFHNYSSGAHGKGGEMYDQLQHERKWSEKLLREVYKDFLTESEITSLLDNKDIWMDGEEVIKRLESRQRKLEAEEAKKEKEEKESTSKKKVTAKQKDA